MLANADTDKRGRGRARGRGRPGRGRAKGRGRRGRSGTNAAAEDVDCYLVLTLTWELAWQLAVQQCCACNIHTDSHIYTSHRGPRPAVTHDS